VRNVAAAVGLDGYWEGCYWTTKDGCRSSFDWYFGGACSTRRIMCIVKLERRCCAVTRSPRGSRLRLGTRKIPRMLNPILIQVRSSARHTCDHLGGERSSDGLICLYMDRSEQWTSHRGRYVGVMPNLMFSHNYLLLVRWYCVAKLEQLL